MVIISAYSCLLLFFSFDFKRILTASLTLLNCVSIFALNRFNAFRLKRFLASIHAVLIIMDLTTFKIFA